jgi:hypothetical protein
MIELEIRNENQENEASTTGPTRERRHSGIEAYLADQI